MKFSKTSNKSAINDWGLIPLNFSNEADGYIYSPQSRLDLPKPLVVLFHGSHGSAGKMLNSFRHIADERQCILLAIDARGHTWDLIEKGGFGCDTRHLSKALQKVFENFSVNKQKIVALGFSDGASYALSLGAINGDFFSHVIAFSPGFMLAPSPVGHPKICISHGQIDKVLDIQNCSRRIVPLLKRDKYDVRYHEFLGGHIIPPDILEASFDWFLE